MNSGVLVKVYPSTVQDSVIVALDLIRTTWNVNGDPKGVWPPNLNGVTDGFDTPGGEFGIGVSIKFQSGIVLNLLALKPNTVAVGDGGTGAFAGAYANFNGASGGVFWEIANVFVSNFE